MNWDVGFRKNGVTAMWCKHLSEISTDRSGVSGIVFQRPNNSGPLLTGCDTPIGYSEITSSLEAVRRNKASGVDEFQLTKLSLERTSRDDAFTLMST